MAAPNSISFDWDDIGTTTLARMRPKVADAVFQAIPFWDWLRSKGRVEIIDGGKHIEERLMYAKNKTVAPYKGMEPMALAPSESLTVAAYTWRQYAGSVLQSGFESIINSGAAAFINLMRHNIDLLTMSFADVMSNDVHALTVNKDLTKQILGLEQIIEPVAKTAQGTLGGIEKDVANPDGDLWWANQVGPTYEGDAGISTDPYVYSDFVTAGDTRPLWTGLTKLLNATAQNGLVRPSDQLILMTQSAYEQFEFENRDLLQMTMQDQNAVNLGWGGIKFKGRTLMWDARVPSLAIDGTTADRHRVYVITAPYISLKVFRQRNFAMTRMFDLLPNRQDAKGAFMLFAGQLTSSNNRHHGVQVWDLP